MFKIFELKSLIPLFKLRMFVIFELVDENVFVKYISIRLKKNTYLEYVLGKLKIIRLILEYICLNYVHKFPDFGRVLKFGHNWTI